MDNGNGAFKEDITWKTGGGLSAIDHRLKLLFGNKSENKDTNKNPLGTKVQIYLPYDYRKVS